MFFINHTDIGEGAAAIIEIDGPLNSDTAPDFDDYITKLADNETLCILIDMKNISFISSEGIGATLMVQKVVNEKNGLVVFFNLNREIQSLFRLLGFDKVFTIADERADALQILDRHKELFPDDGRLTVIEEEDSKTELFPEDDFTDSESTNSEPELLPLIEEEEKFEAFIIECIKCRSLIRITETGEQLCPFCSAEFNVTDDKKAVFKIKEIQS